MEAWPEPDSLAPPGGPAYPDDAGSDDPGSHDVGLGRGGSPVPGARAPYGLDAGPGEPHQPGTAVAPYAADTGDPYPPVSPYPSAPHAADPYGSPAPEPYGAPSVSPYSAPEAEPYGGPEAEPYGGPVADPYGGPAAEPYVPPAAEPYGGPEAEPYAPPAAEPYGGPAAEPYALPAAEPYGAPVAEPYGAPVAEAYGRPVAYPYGPPAGHSHEPQAPYADEPRAAYSYGPAADPYGPPADPYGPPAAPYGRSTAYQYGPQSDDAYEPQPSYAYGPQAGYPYPAANLGEPGGYPYGPPARPAYPSGIPGPGRPDEPPSAYPYGPDPRHAPPRARYESGLEPGLPRPRYGEPYAPGNVPPGPAQSYAPGNVPAGPAQSYAPGSAPAGPVQPYALGNALAGPAQPYAPGNVPPGPAQSYAPGNVPPGPAQSYAPGNVPPGPVQPYPPGSAPAAPDSLEPGYGPAGEAMGPPMGGAGHPPASPTRGPGYEFGYSADTPPPAQADFLPPDGLAGEDGEAGNGALARRADDRYIYAPPSAALPAGPPTGPPGSGPPGFEFPGSGQPRTGRAGSPRRPLLALPAGTAAGAGARSGAGTDDRAATSAYGGEAGRGRPDEQRGGRRALLPFRLPSRPAAGQTADSEPKLPSPFSAAGVKRWALRAAIPMVSMVVVGVAIVATVGGQGAAGPAPATLSVGFPAATPASNDFSATPADQARGISQSLAQVASSGPTLVAAGAQAGARIDRAQFFLSSDGGKTWSLGTEQAAGGGDPAPGHPATLIAGGQGQWAALGPSAIWTSHDGQTWTLDSTQGIAPMRGGDQVSVLRRTATGFLAAGENVPPGDPAAASPVVWTSVNGVTWRRLGAAQLHLAAGGGTAGALTAAAADGTAIVVSGVVSTDKAQGAVRSSGVWRSTDGGASWSAVTVPVSNGATGTIAGLAATANGFAAVRPGRGTGGTDAVVFTSADGTTWKFGATVTGQGGAGLTVATVAGDPSGAVITATSGGNVMAFTSTNGASWASAGSLAGATAGTVSGVAVTTGGALVAAGTAAAGPLSQQPVLTIDNAGRLTSVNVAGIPGAVQPEVAVNGIAADGSAQVAVGSANGFPATWFSADAGTIWSRGTGAAATVLNRPGLQELSGVVHGKAGWVAVGGVQSAAAQHPVVVTSADGRTWQAADTAKVFASAGVFTAAAAAGRGGYVIVGRQTVAGRTIAAAWRSAGLSGWQRGTDATPGALDGAGTSRQMLAAAALPDGFLAVGSAGNRPAAWTSPAGRTWRAVTLSLPGNAVRAQLQQVTVNGRRIVAVGMSATAGGQPAPFTALSVNGGVTWTESLLPSPGGATAVSAVAATGSGFTATGTVGAAGHQDVVIWTATDGLNWTTASPSVAGLGGQGVQEITALTVSGRTLTGVGFAASPASETPTIWRSPIRS